MSNNNKQPREEALKQLRTKDIFYFIDEVNKIKIKSKEVFKNGKKLILYPFKTDGNPKYLTCTKITFVDYKDSADLPRGYYKNFSRGYGFTRVYNNVIFPLVEKNEIKEIVIQKNVPSRIEDNILYLNPDALDRHYSTLESLLSQQKGEMALLVNKILVDLFPENYQKSDKKYVPDSLFNYIRRTINKDTILSDKDVQALFELSSFVSQDAVLANSANILKTKNRIEEHFIEEVINEFENLMSQKTETDNLEKKWQTFFKTYSWIFSQLFSFPVLIFEDEAYTGGKNIQNKGGKFADFLYKNKLTNNIAFIEIKTHNTALLEKRAYRGTDVFAISSGLSGALNQVLDQRENLQHNFYSLKANSKDKSFESYNPRCLIVIGEITSLNSDQIQAFELIRSNSKDVTIITFDEVLEKIKGLQNIMQSSKGS